MVCAPYGDRVKSVRPVSGRETFASGNALATSRLSVVSTSLLGAPNTHVASLHVHPYRAHETETHRFYFTSCVNLVVTFDGFVVVVAAVVVLTEKVL